MAHAGGQTMTKFFNCLSRQVLVSQYITNDNNNCHTLMNEKAETIEENPH